MAPPTRKGYVFLVTLALALGSLGLLLFALDRSVSIVRAAPLRQVPVNDDFANALVISTLPYSDTQNTTLATTQGNDPRFPCIANNPTTNWRRGWHSVWYAYTATADGVLHVDTIGSDFDTVLGIWTGTWGSLVNQGCDDDINWPANPQSSLDIAVTNGTTYYIEVAGYNSSASGNLVLSANLVTPPLNDDFDNAFTIADTPYTFDQSTTLATTAPDDPAPSCGSGGQQSHSVWYRFTPATDGTLYLDTNGSDYDTVLAVWTGARGSLAEAACDDDSGAGRRSALNLAVTAGTTYHIEIVSYGSTAGGSLTLNADLAVGKLLYLHNLAAPVTIIDGTNTTEIIDRQQIWGGEATVTFDNAPIYFSYLHPGLKRDLALQGTIDISLYIEADNGQNSNVTAVIVDLAPDGSTTDIGSATVFVPRNADGWYTFSITGVDYTVSLGHALRLDLNTAAGNQDVTLHYDSAAYNARVQLPAASYVDVEQVSTHSVCHPEGSLSFNPSQAMTVTTRVADPFGSYDIAGANIHIAEPGGAAVVPGPAMTPVVTTTDAITYEYLHTIAATATLGTYTIVVTGTEADGVRATGSTTFSVQSPAVLTVTLFATPAMTNTGQVISVTMRVTNAGQTAATGVFPSVLTLGGTGSAMRALGPSPSTADVAAGEAVTFTWLYTATSFGTVNWTGNVTGTDGNDCAAVSSPAATSNDVLVLPPYQLEVGTASVGNGWTTVNLANTYSDMVVVCSSQYAANAVPIVPRVRNASGSSFEVRLQSPSSGTPVADTVHYMVMETGAYTLPNGIRIEAQKYTSTVTDGRNSSWTGQVQSYLQSYTNPVVLGQVMTYNDPDFSVFWTRGSSSANPPDASNLWTGKMVSKDTDTTRADETVGFIVIEAGHGDLFGVEYEARLGEDILHGVVDSPPYVYNFSQAFSTPPQIGLVSSAAEDGGDGAWAYLYGANPFSVSSIDMALDEDAIGGASRSHPADEQAVYLVFEQPLAIGPYPFLHISKALSQEGGAGLILPGDTLTYTVDYANYGLMPATSAVITDQLPADVTFDSATAGCIHDGFPANGIVTCTLGTLGSFGLGTVTMTVTVDPNLSDNRTLTNTASINSAEGVSATTTITNPVTAFSLLKIETITATVDHNWTSIVLNNIYNDMVVVCTPQYANNAVPLVTRVRNATKSGFEVRLQNPHASDPNVALNAETVHCLAIEAGQSVLPDGRKIEAQKYNSTVTDENNSWIGEVQTYLHAYSNPVVLGQVMTYNDFDWSVFWDRGSARTNPPNAANLRTGKTACEDSDVTRAAETIGFIVIEQGYGTLGSVDYEAWLGADTVLGVGDSPPYSYSFQRAFASSPKIALASMAAVDGGNGGWAVLYGANPLGPNSIDLAIDEDQLGDPERNHTTEQVAYLVFEEPLIIRPTHDLHIAKKDSPDPAVVGQPLVYTIVYTNTGVLTATNTIITETYDSNVNFVSANPTPDGGYDDRWSVGDLVAGESRTLIVTVTVNSGLTDGTMLTNTVTIGCDQTNPVTDTETTQVRSFALSLTKSDSPDPVLAGATLTYTLAYTNAGSADAPDVTITDTLPGDVVFGGVVSAVPPITLTSTSPLVWYTPTLQAGTLGTIVFTVTVDTAAGGTITNSAVITSSLPDDDPADNTHDEPALVTPVAQTVQFSSGSYSVTEGVATARITVTLDVPSGLTVTVDYATADGTAIAGSDYTAVSGTLTFTPGVTSQSFAVPISPDALVDNDETVLLTLSNPSSATITGSNPVTLTILDDDPAPTVAFSSGTYSVSESAGTATITVTLSAASGLTVTVNYATSDGTATAGSDYTAASGTLTLAPGVTSQTFAVPITSDTLDENDETVFLTLSGATNATIGGANPATLTLLDDDPAPTVSFSSGSYSVDEGAGSATINVVLDAASGRTVTINYATSDGTAVAGSDYTAASGTLTFLPGITSQSFPVSIIDDAAIEPDETVMLTLSGASNATIGGTNPATLIITDNDAAPGQVTIDKSVSPSTVETPGQPVTYTYTITIYNAGPSSVRVEQITDTLPAGFTYITTTATVGIRNPDSIVTGTQTTTWSYNSPYPRLDAGDSATLTFLATSNNNSGVYCNNAGVTIGGSIGTITRDNLACVDITWPVYEIVSRVGNTTIRVRVRMEPTGPVVISWEILP